MSNANQITPPDGPPLPEMREAFLSRDDLTSLAADLQQCTRILGVLRKGATRDHADSVNISFTDALAELSTGTVTAVQVRYAYDNHEWTDTLLNTPQGVRLVRCRHEV